MADLILRHRLEALKDEREVLLNRKAVSFHDAVAQGKRLIEVLDGIRQVRAEMGERLQQARKVTA